MSGDEDDSASADGAPYQRSVASVSWRIESFANTCEPHSITSRQRASGQPEGSDSM